MKNMSKKLVFLHTLEKHVKKIGFFTRVRKICVKRLHITYIPKAGHKVCIYVVIFTPNLEFKH